MRVYLRFEAVCKKSGVAHLSPHLITRLKFDQKIAKAVAGYLEFILIKWLNPALLPHRIHPTPYTSNEGATNPEPTRLEPNH